MLSRIPEKFDVCSGVCYFSCSEGFPQSRVPRVMNRFFPMHSNLTYFNKRLPWSNITALELDPKLIEPLRSLGCIKEK